MLGHASNAVTDGAVGATIGGGGRDDGSNDLANEVSNDFGTVGGGRSNTAADLYATVGGGLSNEASASSATVGGGDSNAADAEEATVGGGLDNTASGEEATVGGGIFNTASGLRATVPGGQRNTADGDYSFAAGLFADTNGHAGAFVLGDSTSTGIQAQNDDEVRSQMPIYAPSFNTTSARAEKTNVDSVDPREMLDGVVSLDIRTWELDHAGDGRHVGPMAGDFHDAFGLGSDEETIATVDADGVALAAIQGLAERFEREEKRLRDELDEKESRIDDLEAENEALRDRLAAIETHLDLEAGGSEPANADD